MANTKQIELGSVVSLWRYPVKSMTGEELNATEVTDRGLLGDRAYALVDPSNGKIASAKNPRKWGKLFDFRPAFVEPLRTGQKGEHETRLTRAFSGRPARGIINRFMMAVDRADAANAILPYPLQNALTRPLRNAAARQGRTEFLSLWAGQGVRMARRQSAASLIARLRDETEAVLRRLAIPD